MNVKQKIQDELKVLGERRAEVFTELQKAGAEGDWQTVSRTSVLLCVADARIEGFIQALELLKAPQVTAIQPEAEKTAIAN